MIYVFGSGMGWWLAIALMAAIREKLAYSNLPKGMHGMAITFFMTGIMSMAFMGFTGINLSRPTGNEKVESKLVVENSK